MPPSPLDDRIVVALPRRAIRPQELHLCLDTTTTTSHHAHHATTATHHATTTTHHATSYLDVAAAATTTAVSATTTLTKTEESSTAIITSTTVVKIRASSGSNLTYMPSSSGSTRSLTCGCSSASCCTVSTYEKDASGSSSRTQQQSQQQQHSYSYHHHHTQQQQVSASSPDLSTHAGGGAGGFGGGGGSGGFRVGGAGPSSSIVGHSEALSAPSLTSTERERDHALPPPPPSLPASASSTSGRPAYRVIHPNELAKRLGRCPMGHALPMSGSQPGVILIDCRPFMEYNKSHIQGAVHINCSDKISRRRLQQGKITVLDLISCRADEEGKDSFRGLFSKEIVVYDESTAEPARLSVAQPLHVVLESLRREGKDPIVLKGGLSAFRQQHAALCEHSLHLHQEGLEAGALTTSTSPTSTMSLSGALPHSLPSTPDIENAELTPILPFLYLGNEHDAQDLELMQRVGIGFILNVTTHLPLFHYDRGLFSYKRLPATDSNKQNLRQYFEEAFEFIEEAQQAGQGVLIHCQAGVSRSATIVIAYLMKHSWMTMTDAYKFVKARRPIISPNLNFMGQLLEFGEDLNSGVTPRILTPKLVGMETMV